MVLVRSARTTGAELVATAAAAWEPVRGAGLPSTAPAATAARAARTATTMARGPPRRRDRPGSRMARRPGRRRDRPGSRSAVMTQARQRRGRDLGVEQRPAGLRGPLEDRTR